MVCGALHQCNWVGNLVGAATQAWTIAVFLCLFTCAIENDVAAQRPARGARWAAVNVRRAYGQNERAIGAAVARTSGGPIARCGARRNVLSRVGRYVCHVHEATIKQAQKQFYPEMCDKVKI